MKFNGPEGTTGQPERPALSPSQIADQATTIIGNTNREISYMMQHPGSFPDKTRRPTYTIITPEGEDVGNFGAYVQHPPEDLNAAFSEGDTDVQIRPYLDDGGEFSSPLTPAGDVELKSKVERLLGLGFSFARVNQE